MIIGIVVTSWIVLGFVGYGLLLGGATKEFPYFNNIRHAVVGFLFGPIGLLATLLTYPFGWRVVPLSQEERYAIFVKEYGEDFRTREEFNQKY